MVLVQEEKFKYYYNQLCDTVKKYEAAISKLRTSIRPLLRPHMEDMLRKIAPGLVMLTWTSMNIDGYLHKFKSGLARSVLQRFFDFTLPLHEAYKITVMKCRHE